ncbi:MAG: radical SAM protein [Planctomycetes bacterium]|nr:radical SAM protein [Planctomycetota bacterium]
MCLRVLRLPKDKNKTFELSPDFSVSSLPRVIRIEVSGLCNLRCIHCPTGVQKGDKGGIMSWDVFDRIVDEIKKYMGVDVVVLYHGGESFLNKNIFKMISFFKEMEIPRIQTNTNGCIITDDMLEKIVNSGLTRIEFSIDGLSPEENNEIRRGCDYHKVASTIKKLLRLRRKEKYSALKDIHIVNVQIPSEEQVRSTEEVAIPKYLLDDFSEFKEEITFKSSYMIKWPAFDCSDQYKIIQFPISPRSEPLNYCDHVTELITFRWNGDVVPCCYDIAGQYVIGNIMEHSLEEIWNNKRYKALRESIHLGKFIPLCANCNNIQPLGYVVKRR